MRDRAYLNAKQAARRARRKAMGICRECPEPAVFRKTLCVDCAKGDAESRRLARERAGLMGNKRLPGKTREIMEVTGGDEGQA